MDHFFRMRKALLPVLFALLTSSDAALVYDIKVEFRNDAEGEELRDSSGGLLSAGESETPGDGAQLQYGYFSLATRENPFLGAFIPLTGENSGNSYLSTVADGIIPEQGKPPGRFWIGVEFAFPHTRIGIDLPLEGTPMALRFWDGTTIAGLSHFNTVANSTDLWDWQYGTGRQYRAHQFGQSRRGVGRRRAPVSL